MTFIKKVAVLFLMFFAGLSSKVFADIYIFSIGDVVFCYYDNNYDSYLTYAEYKADVLFSQGEVNDALWYYRNLSYFYPSYYKGWYGIIRCFSRDFENLNFSDSEKYIEKLRLCKNKPNDVQELLSKWDASWPEIQKQREIFKQEQDKKRADHFYNMKFIRHDGVLEQYTGSDTEVIIPSDVTVIGQAAFRNTPVKTIVFHDKVTEIQKDAFAMCGNLQSVVIPSTIKKLGEGVFRQCNNLESVEIPSSIKIIPNNCFAGCGKLKTVSIENGVQEIDKGFTGCSSLSAILVPPSVLKINDFAFSGCTNLKTLTYMNENIQFGRRSLYGTHLENKDQFVEKFGASVFN